MDQKNLKELRSQKGWSQSELAALSGLSVKTIQRIENGQGVPSLETAKSLGSVFDIAFSEFLPSAETKARPLGGCRAPAGTGTASSQASLDAPANLLHHAQRYWRSAAPTLFVIVSISLLVKLCLKIGIILADVSEIVAMRDTVFASDSAISGSFFAANLQRETGESLEQRTVLLIGPFSPGDSQPISVEIVELLEDVDGNSLVGLSIEKVTALAAGPSLVLAERFAPDTSGLEGEYPEETAQAVLLTWEGGVTGPQGADLAEAQRTVISTLLANGDRVNPLSLGDGDPDNHVFASLTETSPALSVSVEAGYFHDPGDDANPETNIDVISKIME